MKKATIIVNQDDTYNSMFDALFWELRSDPDVYFIIEKNYPESGIYRYLPSRTIQSVTRGYSNNLYQNWYILPKLIDDLNNKYDHVSVLIHNAALKSTMYPLHLIKWLRKKAAFNLLYLDVHDHYWVCQYANFLADNNAFDKVFTVDPNDAQRYGYSLCYTPYSIVNSDRVRTDSNENIPIYFCGRNAGRIYKLYKIWEEAKKRGISVTYDLAASAGFKDFFEGDASIRFNKHLPYSEMLKVLPAVQCILDIPQEGQTALTLRPYEAVVYNKKLLTNSKSIKSFKYYDSRYMQCFEKIEDIDWEWVVSDINVDYGYQGDFSPYRLLEQLA